jgi:hypothetical protein
VIARGMFTLYLVVIVGGLLCFIVIGLTHR